MARLLKLVLHRFKAAELRHPLRVIHTSAQGVLDRLRLLEDLLEHEVRVRPAFHRVRAHFERGSLPADGAVFQGGNGEAARLQARHLIVLEIHCLIRVARQRGSVGGRKAFVNAHAQDKGTSAPRHDDLMRVGRVQHRQTERALNL